MSTSAAVVRIWDGMMEYVQIGDCLILCVHNDSNYELLCDIPNQDVDLFLQSELKGVRDHIRRIEATDAKSRGYPHFKTHDDIAAIGIDYLSYIQFGIRNAFVLNV